MGFIRKLNAVNREATYNEVSKKSAGLGIKERKHSGVSEDSIRARVAEVVSVLTAFRGWARFHGTSLQSDPLIPRWEAGKEGRSGTCCHKSSLMLTHFPGEGSGPPR